MNFGESEGEKLTDVQKMQKADKSLIGLYVVLPGLEPGFKV